MLFAEWGRFIDEPDALLQVGGSCPFGNSLKKDAAGEQACSGCLHRRNRRLDVERLFTDARVKVGTMLQMIHCWRCEGLPYGEPVIPGGLD
jgi:hypothetical protein